MIACLAACFAIASPIARSDSWGADGQTSSALITEHSLGQNGPASTAVRCGQLDPWAYRLVCSGSGSGADRTTRVAEVATSSTASGSQVSQSTGFDWLDASVGAAATLGLLLLVGGAGAFALRRRRTIAHVSS